MTTCTRDISSTLHHGDSLHILPTLPAQSVDAVVTDPPYELGFMGKGWDATGIAYHVDLWREVLRVLKPGGHLLAFGGSRTYHRMACAIEDAGFAVRDQLMWLYGSGFPKSHNLHDDWEGWGTALKPAHEPICLARVPFRGTVEQNIAAWGTGAVNVDGCRIETMDNLSGGGDAPVNFFTGKKPDRQSFTQPPGRWPANVLHDGSAEVVAGFPESESSGHTPKTRGAGGIACDGHAGQFGMTEQRFNASSAARFFYCAKADAGERNAGCEGISKSEAGCGALRDGTRSILKENHHPTVKTIALMRWLCRLVTPPGGVVLDPFLGSGTTGCAAALENFSFIGIEREADYLAIARARIAYWSNKYGLFAE